jgi:hypothetical protein
LTLAEAAAMFDRDDIPEAVRDTLRKAAPPLLFVSEFWNLIPTISKRHNSGVFL